MKEGSCNNIFLVFIKVDKILKVIPRERRTYLYSATMTKKVNNLQNSIWIEIIET